MFFEGALLLEEGSGREKKAGEICLAWGMS